MPLGSIFRALQRFACKRAGVAAPDYPRTPYPGVPFHGQFPPVTHDHPLNDPYVSGPYNPNVAPTDPDSVGRPACAACGDTGYADYAAVPCEVCGGPPRATFGRRKVPPAGPALIAPALGGYMRLVTADDIALLDAAKAIRDNGGDPQVIDWNCV